MPAPTLEGRLVCASVCAYDAVADGPVAYPPSNVYAAGAGFTGPPVGFVAGRLQVDAALVGTSDVGVVVAFRGTLPFEFLQYNTLVDWLGNFNARPAATADYPGHVHGGFLAALNGLWDGVLAEVRGQLAASGGPLFVAGHSKGGAMASLAAWRFRAAGLPARVVTFASPKPGGPAFQAAYDAAIDHTRYEYADDIVPHLPPSQDGFLNVLSSLPFVGHRFKGLERFDYQPVGTLRYIDHSGRPAADNPNLRPTRALGLVQTVVLGRSRQFAADHSIACGSGFMSALCPDGVCPQG